MEWSLQTRCIEKDVVPTARELGVGIVPYSPLGRGLLSATFTDVNDLPEGDWRRTQPRFHEENLKKNAPNSFFAIAAKKGCTPAQLALAWVHNQGPDVFPIPGTKSPERIEENTVAATISLTPEEMREIEASIPEVAGERYSDLSSSYNVRV
jgi:aryl-alcohol dehydrogenase-like predicted oxidoreductase